MPQYLRLIKVKLLSSLTMLFEIDKELEIMANKFRVLTKSVSQSGLLTTSPSRQSILGA
jgi:hypothetical protein